MKFHTIELQTEAWVKLKTINVLPHTYRAAIRFFFSSSEPKGTRGSGITRRH